MKYALFIFSLIVMTDTIIAHPPGGHDHKALRGPHGGKMLEIEGGHVEFAVQADRSVKVFFYNDALKPIVPSTQVVAVTAQAPGGSAKLAFEVSEEAFISRSLLPEGEGYFVVVQIKTSAESKPKNFRIKLDLSDCGGCQLREYACVCEGHNH
jgi:hypothetical protein